MAIPLYKRRTKRGGTSKKWRNSYMSGGPGAKATFRKRDGGTFTKYFKSRASMARAIKGWMAAGGKLAKRR